MHNYFAGMLHGSSRRFLTAKHLRNMYNALILCKRLDVSFL